MYAGEERRRELRVETCVVQEEASVNESTNSQPMLSRSSAS